MADENKDLSQEYITVRGAFIILTCVFLFILLGFGYFMRETRDLAQQTVDIGEINKQLINENIKRIEENRANSLKLCRRNFEAVRLIIKPFYPPPPLTLEELKFISEFNARVNKLKRLCATEFQN